MKRRYSELLDVGKPEQILVEFPSEELVRSAGVLFDHHVSHGSLHLYSDRAFKDRNGRNILQAVEKRLQASPLYQGGRHAAFICNDRWKEEFFLKGSGKLGGLNHYPTAPHVFLTRAWVDEDAMVSPRGRPIAHPRTLTYYVTHEFTHTIMGRNLSDRAWRRLPHWIFEGYPDYVGLGPEYTYEVALKAYEHRDPRVKGTMAEDYMRYGAMVAYALEKEKMTVEELLIDPPAEDELATEARVSK